LTAKDAKKVLEKLWSQGQDLLDLDYAPKLKTAQYQIASESEARLV
jgi:hypothetical protein